MIEVFRDSKVVVFMFTDVTEIVKEFGRQRIEDIKNFSDMLVKELRVSGKAFLSLISIENYDELVKIYGLESSLMVFGELELKIRKLLVNMGLSDSAECLTITNGSTIILFKGGFSDKDITVIEEAIVNMLSSFEVDFLARNILLTT